ncbi:hypothetical protein [Lacinutrix chionoecetis]
MKSKFILTLFGAILSLSVYSQTISQDTEGYSNIILPSAQLNLDIANNIATIDYINYFSSSSDNNKFLYGTRLSGKAVNGTSVLFSKEKIASSASINGLLAFSSKKTFDTNENIQERDNLVALSRKLDRDKEALSDAYNSFLNQKFSDEIILNPLLKILKSKSKIDVKDKQPTDKLKGQLKTLKSEYKAKEIVLRETLISGTISEDEQLKIEQQLAEGQLAHDEIVFKFIPIIEKGESYDAVVKELKNYESTVTYRHHLVYVRGGFNGSSFDYDLNNGANTVGERFQGVNFNGWQAEIGYNYNYENHYAGISFTSAYLNNIEALKEVEFSLTSVDETISSGTFTSTETVKAFKGEFDRYLRHSINIEYAKLIPLEKRDGGLYLSASAYMRHRFYERSETINNNTVLGGGLFAFNTRKNQILGGIFLQTNDLFKTQKNAENTLGKRITFGLVAKYAFSGTNIK